MGIKLHLQAWNDLLNRYKLAIGHAWSHRKEFDLPSRLSHETQFLPAALSLQETPVSPAPRVAMWSLITFSFLAVVWSIFGHLDMVAVAQGKVVPNERVKVIQPVETSTVKAIFVTDGRNVKAGDVLIELDETATGADTIRLENDLTVARLQSARSEAFLAAMGGKEPVLGTLNGLDEERLKEEQRRLDSQWHEYKSKLERVEADVARREAELRSIREIVNKLERTVPIARDREVTFKRLMEQDIVSKQQYQETQKTLIEQEGDLSTYLEKVRETEAALLETQGQRTALIAETRRTFLDSQHEADQKATQNAQELVKARQRHKLMKLISPVDGSVQQLAIHTVGGVVTPAQQLMVIVPNDDPLEVEAFLENKDIGFVNNGQESEIKIETFPYTKYGTIHGEVKHVSCDAIQDDKKGLIYSCRVKLDKTQIRVENKDVNLTAGMAVTVEIKTGKRRVIEYFLTPLIQYTSESLRER